MTTESTVKFGGLLTGTLLALSFLGNKPAIHSGKNSQTGGPNIVFMIADDWSYPHAGVYGDAVVNTPNFDWLADKGALFQNAFCASPSCSPSRASILTSRYPHQLESAGNLWSVFPGKFPNWVSILDAAGYHTGKSRKGWGPGDYQSGGYEDNPAGRDFPDFKSFLSLKKEGQPFVYWFGSQDPHRTYETNAGVRTGMEAGSIQVPAFMPDLPCIRNDMMDYYFEVERFDRECGSIIETLKKKGFIENTIIVMTSDNGMPFPRAKANLYDYGTRMPLAIYWPGHIEGGKRMDEFVNFVDFGPTFLEAATLEIPPEFQGRSLLEMFSESAVKGYIRDKVFLERERHANVRKGNLSYPSRALRNRDFLYIRNFAHDRWPAGDPEVHQSVGQYGDIDNSISKFLMMAMEGEPENEAYFQLAFGKRPSEELYILANDPYNLINEAKNPEYTGILDKMRGELAHWMRATQDRRARAPATTYWDTVLYTPDYQFHNFDLQENIIEYKMLVREGGEFKESGCMQ